MQAVTPIEVVGLERQPGRRISVIGTSGSGKTTMAKRLASRLGLPHVELDALHWGPNWTEEPDAVFRERAGNALASWGWVVDGNYHVVRDIVWSRADTLVWLDYSLPLILWRLTRRTFRRAAGREEIWHGNRESLRTHFFTKDSLYLWVLQTYRRRRREYPQLFRDPEFGHLKVIHLRSAREAGAWLARVRAE